MKRRGWSYLGAGALVVLLLLLIPITRELLLGVLRGEGFHKGRPASYWVARLRDPNPQARDEAIMAMYDLGPSGRAAIPTLVEMMTEQDGQFEGVATPGDRRLIVSGALAEILTGLGTEARESIPAVTGLLNSNDPTTRLHTAEILKAVGPNARAAIPALTPTVRDSWPYVRSEAVKAMKAIDRDALLKALMVALEDESEDIRSDAAENLGWFGARGKAAIPKLRELCRDRSARVRSKAEAALKDISGVTPGPD